MSGIILVPMKGMTIFVSPLLERWCLLPPKVDLPTPLRTVRVLSLRHIRACQSSTASKPNSISTLSPLSPPSMRSSNMVIAGDFSITHPSLSPCPAMMKETVAIGRDTSKHTTASAPYATGMIGISSFDQVSDGDNEVVCGGDGVIACSHAVVGCRCCCEWVVVSLFFVWNFKNILVERHTDSC